MQELVLRETLDCYRMSDMRRSAQRNRVLDTRVPRRRFRFALRRR